MEKHMTANFNTNEMERVPGFLFVDHIAIAVLKGELDAQVEAYQLMGFQEMHREEILGKDQVRESLLRIGNSPNLIQLLEPLSDQSPVQKMIERGGGKGGLAHVGFRVKDIHAAFNHLKKEGFNIIDAAPRPGSRGTTVFFIHPKSRDQNPFGVLFEVVEDPQDK
ncbi:MAG: VOC family protein [SAR324 cluster bacterium]|nr:VOC family protein [SAR324 cluster bacterium]MBF0351448.1 VOC family protein [SAR324 cluster bacterium]